MQKKQLWALRWHPVGFSNTFSAYIIAEDTFEANYLWNKFRKANRGVEHTWDRARNRVQGFATFHEALDSEKDSFKKLFPRKRKCGVYLCNEEPCCHPSDHLDD